MELNEQQFSLFDADDYEIEHPGQMRRAKWQGQDDIMWHSTTPIHRDLKGLGGDLQWDPSVQESHAGTLSAAYERSSFKSGVAWPLRPRSRTLDNTPDNPESDVLANLAVNPEYAVEEDLSLREELGDDPHHGPIIRGLERGAPTYQEGREAVDAHIAASIPEYKEGLYYRNTHEDEGSISVVAPGRSLHTHHDDVRAAQAQGLTVQPAVRAEADVAKRSPLRLHDVVSAQQITPEIVGNVGGAAERLGTTIHQSYYEPSPLRGIPHGPAQIPPTTTYNDIGEISAFSGMKRPHDRGKNAKRRIDKEVKDFWGEDYESSQGLF